MTLQGDIVAETGIDLADPKLNETLAPALADRLTTAFPAFGDAHKAITSIMTAYKGMSAAPTVLGAVGIAVAAVGAAAGLLEGRLDKDISGNRKRLEDARNLTIQHWIKPGDWSTVVYAAGGPPGSIDRHNNAYGWEEWEFLRQYNPGLVWMSHRSGKSDILLPTWPTPPFTNGYGFMSADQGVVFPRWSPLTGFTVTKRTHRIQQPSVKPIPSEYDDVYFGTMPEATLTELSEAGMEGAPKFLQSLILKMESAYFNQSFIPPGDYSYLFSVGTYPYTTWSTASNGMPGPGASVTLNASMAAIAAAIHSVTPIHAMVREAEVVKCYRAWLKTTRLRQLPPLPKGQVDTGIYLDAFGLPWSPSPLATVMCIQPVEATAPPEYEWQEEALERCKADPSLAHQINSACFPSGFGASGYALSVTVMREIEVAFRSFFTIRRAALYQMALATTAFQTAAANSPDPVMAAAAKGRPPPYKAWDASDPLGDGWRKKGYAGTGTVEGPKPGAVKKEPVPENPPIRKRKPGKAIAVPRQSSELWQLALAGAAGLAALGYHERARLGVWLQRLNKRLRSGL